MGHCCIGGSRVIKEFSRLTCCCVIGLELSIYVIYCLMLYYGVVYIVGPRTSLWAKCWNSRGALLMYSGIDMVTL